LAAAGALVLALIVLAIVLLTGGSSYKVRLLFTNASGLVTGNQVMIGPANVGTVESIGLTSHGEAAIVVDLDSDASPLHQGTVARIEENGLAGIADHYITLEPASSSHPTIRSGGTISTTDTASEVSLDQVFDALDPLTRAGLRNVIRGEATAIDGRSSQASKALEYLAPGLYSTSQVTRELSRSEPAFDALLVRGAQTMQALASRTEQLTALVASTNQTTGAIASQSTALSNTLGLLPGTLTRSSTTFAGLRATLSSLNPVVTAAKPAAVPLGRFSVGLRKLEQVSIPTVASIDSLISTKSSSGNLIGLLQETPGLTKLAGTTIPEVVAALERSAPQLAYLLAYTPDVVAALTNVGQASANYDANGHYTRTQPWFGAFGLTANSQLISQPASDRYNGLQVVHGRCPGGAIQPAPDHSAPVATPGCTTSSSLPGS
jgi:phospholipid/cholesterol/gamma-HCH transport system substrate-binding protein